MIFVNVDPCKGLERDHVEPGYLRVRHLTERDQRESLP